MGCVVWDVEEILTHASPPDVIMKRFPHFKSVRLCVEGIKAGLYQYLYQLNVW